MTDSKPTTAAFIGLGVMGFPMAGHLVTNGHTVRAYNRTAARAANWHDAHAERASTHPTPAEAAAGADIVFMCVGNDDDVRAVAYGDDGVLQAMSSGAILVDHTTASQGLAVELAEACSAKDIGFLDAPVSGGQAGADNGALTVMVGGDETIFAQAPTGHGCLLQEV